MHFRQTLAGEISMEGIGLHTGQPVQMSLKPAESGSGVVFVRRDASFARIPATLEFVGPSYYATVLERDGVTVSTIEHLMAALYALRVDDLIVELDGPEVPIFDGSSSPFVEVIRQVGLQDQQQERQYMTLVRPVVVTDDEDSEKRIAAYPGRDFRITYAIDFEHPVLGYQELSVGLWEDDAFADKLAPARTFTFEKDVETLRQRGLALGGSLDNAVVLGEREVLNDSLRFSDEFVRHKMLDLTGDVSLLGHPLRAHLLAYRAGHDLHGKLARRIWEAQGCWYLAPWSEIASNRDLAARG